MTLIEKLDSYSVEDADSLCDKNEHVTPETIEEADRKLEGESDEEYPQRLVKKILDIIPGSYTYYWNEKHEFHQIEELDV